jgi:type IV pilus assembly protein PilV
MSIDCSGIQEMRLHKKYTPFNEADQRGFTLVEVLVALVVLSVGLLGMAKMVMVSSHSNDSAYLRSQATVLAYQAMDSMRANLIAASGYATAVNVMPAATGNCSAVCGNTALALSDVYAWKQHLKNALPAGTGSITTTATFPVMATVVVQWDDSAAQSAFKLPAAANTQTITLQTVLQ